ncbi:MAG: GTP-binding protein [bacterium]
MSNHIRNFAIISHIDHGKSTLADRFLELTQTVGKKEMHARFLDSMALEQEKGITIKLKAVRMSCQMSDISHPTSDRFILNLIDTPGHVDFSYEVSRALAACEGALLLVDATQGIQAQTLAVLYKALDLNLTIIPVINKVDLPTAGSGLAVLEQQMRDLLGGYGGEVSKISAKTGGGVEGLLQRIVKEIPSPKSLPCRQAGKYQNKLRALIFDSYYDQYKGVVALVRVFGGTIEGSSPLYAVGSKTEFEPLELGFFTPHSKKTALISAGEVGYIATGLKDISKVRVGDTIVSFPLNPLSPLTPLPGYRAPQAMVFLSLYPKDAARFGDLKKALEHLNLTDAALTVEPENTPALGVGFKVGFLGLLHAEITVERLKREYGLDLISTIPQVAHKKVEGDIYEPKVKGQIFTPRRYLGAVLKLTDSARGEFLDTRYLSEDSVLVEAKLPLSELVANFYDRLKSLTSGYASLSYEFLGFEKEDLVLLDILVHGEKVAALSQIVPRARAYAIGSQLIKKLKDTIPREQFKVALQAAIGGKIIARETLPAFRKDVTAKLYGGDRTRRDKLLKKQARGKKRMGAEGRVNLSPEAIFKLVSS